VSSGSIIMIVVLSLSFRKCVLYLYQRSVEFCNECYIVASMSLIPNLNLDVTKGMDGCPLTVSDCASQCPLIISIHFLLLLLPLPLTLLSISLSPTSCLYLTYLTSQQQSTSNSMSMINDSITSHQHHQ
jgi:hypothetical protein